MLQVSKVTNCRGTSLVGILLFQRLRCYRIIRRKNEIWVRWPSILAIRKQKGIIIFLFLLIFM
jgi:hypothetical protein